VALALAFGSHQGAALSPHSSSLLGRTASSIARERDIEDELAGRIAQQQQDIKENPPEDAEEVGAKAKEGEDIDTAHEVSPRLRGKPMQATLTVKPLPEENNTHPRRKCRMPRCRRANCTHRDPDCCNVKMDRMLQDVAKFLEDNHHNFAVTYGSLLGAVRNGTIIPWSSDVDLSVESDGIDALLKQDVLPYHFFRTGPVVRGCPNYEDGLERFWEEPGGVTSVGNDDGHRVYYYMDIYPDAWIKGLGNGDCSASCVRAGNSTNEVKIYGRMYPSVSNTTDCLHTRYGSDFMTVKHVHGDDDKLS